MPRLDRSQTNYGSNISPIRDLGVSLGLSEDDDSPSPMNSQMKIAPNPYEPPIAPNEDRDVLARFRDWYRLPFPVRVGEENPFQWIADTVVALILLLVGCGIADFFHQSSSFLEPIAYSVGLMLGCFPIGMWMHYCRVSQFTPLSATLLISLVLAVRAGAAGLHGLHSLPLAFAVLLVVLPCQHLLGKLVLGWLPLSSTRNHRENKPLDTEP